MPRWAKIVLVVVIIALGAMITGVVFTGRWIRARAEQFHRDTTAAQSDGRRYGVGREAEACVGASLDRVKECPSMLCEPATVVFLMNCLETASTPSGYCEDITSRTAADECKRRGWGSNDRCERLIALVRAHCEQPVQTSTANSVRRIDP